MVVRFLAALAVATAIGLSGTACFDPELASCSVTCTPQTGCPGQLSCNAGGYCVGNVEDVCTSGTLDARADETDARLADAATSDAMITFQLHVVVLGQGRVIDTSHGIDCEDSCMYALPLNTNVALVPQTNGAWEFNDWIDMPCNQSGGAVCDLVMDRDHRATAEFELD